MNLIAEIYQFLFISSIIFMVSIFGNLIIKVYGRFALNKETRFQLTISDKILLLFSMATFLTYIIK